MADADHPRLILHNFLSLDSCRELEFIHKSNSTVGYRPNVFSTTLSHLIATNSAHLIMPFIPIRERLKEKVEEFFGCEYELFVEFTGLISWSKGASIGWHSDDNRPYLKQRDFAAVCYLNSYGVDFGGGLFHFQDAEPATFIPMTGDVLMYTADCRNIHSVDEMVKFNGRQLVINFSSAKDQLDFGMWYADIPLACRNSEPSQHFVVQITDGERLTLTLWFTRDRSHDEDSKLISFITQKPLNNSSKLSMYPMPASDNMYWFPPEQASNCRSGFDLRCARLHVLSYDLYSSKLLNLLIDSSLDFSEVLAEPLQLLRGNELFKKEFANVLHLLQVVQFYNWKGNELQKSETKMKTKSISPLSQSELKKISELKLVLLKDLELAETVFGYMTRTERMHKVFDWDTFSAAVVQWEAYTRKLIEEMLMHWPYWRIHQSLFFNPLLNLKD